MTKGQAVANKYDLSASRYREIEHDDVFYEEPEVTLARLRGIEDASHGLVRRIEAELVPGA